MTSYKQYECTYVRDGVARKEGPNQGKEFSIVQLKEFEQGKNGIYHGNYTATVFCWHNDYIFDVGGIYNCMIDSNNGNDRLISVEG